MADPLNIELEPLPISKGGGFRQLAQEQRELIPKAAAARTEAELLPKQIMAQEKGKAAEDIFQDLSTRLDEKRAKEAEFPYPEFHPTQDNAVSLGGLFSMVATMGVALGGSGKLSSMNALNAMGGMLQGWQQGRKDLYEKEKATFDKEFNRIKQIRADLEKDLKEYFELAPYHKEAAYLKAEEMAYKYPGVAAAKTRSAQFDDLLKLNEGLIKIEAEIEKKAGVGGKLSPKMEAELQGNITLAQNLSDLSRMVDWVGKNEVGVFGPVVGRVPGDVSQLYQSDRAKQTKALLADLMSKKLKDRSGATVTVQEWARAQPFIPTDKDTPDTIQSKLRSMYDLIAEETEIYAERSKAGGAIKSKFSTMDQPLQPSFRAETRGETTSEESISKEQVDKYRSQAKAKIDKDPATEEKVRAKFKDLTGQEL
jgi:hypothetical protein